MTRANVGHVRESQGSPPDDTVGISGLESVTLITQGTSASIYRARQPALDRLVAVKVLRSKRTGRRFATCDLGVLADHPHVVRIFAFGVTGDGRPFLVMPYLPGSLWDRVEADGPLPWQEVVDIGIKLAGALETAHRAGQAHGNLGPSNILYSEYGEPFLAGLPLASPRRVRKATNLAAKDVADLAATLLFLGTGTAPPGAGAQPPAGLSILSSLVAVRSPTRMGALGLAAALQGFQRQAGRSESRIVVQRAVAPAPADNPRPARSRRRTALALGSSVALVVGFWSLGHRPDGEARLSPGASQLVDPASRDCTPRSTSTPVGDGVSITSPSPDATTGDLVQIRGTAALAPGEALFVFAYAPKQCVYYFSPDPVSVGSDGHWFTVMNLGTVRGWTTSVVAGRVTPAGLALLSEIGRVSTGPAGRAPSTAAFPSGTSTANVRITIGSAR